jgi:hypothetical protein
MLDSASQFVGAWAEGFKEHGHLPVEIVGCWFQQGSSTLGRMRLDERPGKGNTMILDFGKHKGKPVHRVPKNYLRWMLREIDDLSPQLRTAVEYGLRGEAYDPPTLGIWEPHNPDEIIGV